MSFHEMFGGKKALGILLKSARTLSKTLQILQFCFGALNTVLYVFFLKFASVLKYNVCKEPVFVVTSAHDCKNGNAT